MTLNLCLFNKTEVFGFQSNQVVLTAVCVVLCCIVIVASRLLSKVINKLLREQPSSCYFITSRKAVRLYPTIQTALSVGRAVRMYVVSSVGITATAPPAGVKVMFPGLRTALVAFVVVYVNVRE